MSRIEHLAFLPAHELAIRMRRREIKAVWRV